MNNTYDFFTVTVSSTRKNDLIKMGFNPNYIHSTTHRQQYVYIKWGQPIVKYFTKRVYDVQAETVDAVVPNASAIADERAGAHRANAEMVGVNVDVRVRYIACD